MQNNKKLIKVPSLIPPTPYFYHKSHLFTQLVERCIEIPWRIKSQTKDLTSFFFSIKINAAIDVNAGKLTIFAFFALQRLHRDCVQLFLEIHMAVLRAPR